MANKKAKLDQAGKSGVIALAARSMLVYVGASKLGTTKKDEAATSAALAQFGAADDAGSFMKRLFPKETPAIKAVNAAFAKAMKIYEDETLPWLDGGGRLLLSVNYGRFTELIRGVRSEIETALDNLKAVYSDLVDAQAPRLGNMFNRADYPSVSELDEIYGLYVKVDPVPTSASFKVEMEDDIVAELKAQIDANTMACYEDAVSENYGRLWDVVSHMAKILRTKDPKRSIKDVLVDNVRAAVEAIPRFNITNDQTLIDKGNEILKDLCSLDGSELRESELRREVVAQRAEEITAELAKIVGIEEEAPEAPAPAPVKAEKKPKAKAEPKAKKMSSEAARAEAIRKSSNKAKAKDKAPAAPVIEPELSLAEADAIAADFGAIFGGQ